MKQMEKGGEVGTIEASQAFNGPDLVQSSHLLYAGAITVPISQIRRLRLRR